MIKARALYIIIEQQVFYRFRLLKGRSRADLDTLSAPDVIVIDIIENCETTAAHTDA
jgi:hypothetical protein